MKSKRVSSDELSRIAYDHRAEIELDLDHDMAYVVADGVEYYAVYDGATS